MNLVIVAVQLGSEDICDGDKSILCIDITDQIAIEYLIGLLIHVDVPLGLSRITLQFL